MWWNMIAGAAEGFSTNYYKTAQINIGNRLSDVNAAAGNKVRQAQNAAEASRNNLARWTQSVNNNRALKSGGEALNANITNYYREADSALMGGFSDQIREAENEGASNASAAFAGVDGSVVDMVNGSVALRDSMVREAATRRNEMFANDTAVRAGTIMSQMVGGLDNSLVLDSLDYNVDVAQHQKPTSQFMAAVIGATRGAGVDASNGAWSQEKQQTEYKTEFNGVAARQGSASQYDLADNAYDSGSKYRFGYEYQAQSDNDPYSLSGTRLGDNASNRDYTSNDYSIWSR